MISAIHYRCYRLFLLDHLTENRLSYRGFAAKYGCYISFPFLSKLLRRDSAGQFSRDVNLRCERLAALLKAMGVAQKDISHLILCRLENDKRTGGYKHSTAFSETLKSLQGSKVNSSYLKIFEGLENLLTPRRQKVIEELKAQLSIEVERTNSPLKIQKLRHILEAL